MRVKRGSKFEKPHIPIAPVLESYGGQIPSSRGGWQAMRCPFHDDSNKSASVNMDSGHFCCFAGCTDRTEDTIGLVMHIDCLDFQSAKRKAEEIAGVSDSAVRGHRRKRSSVLDEPWS